MNNRKLALWYAIGTLALALFAMAAIPGSTLLRFALDDRTLDRVVAVVALDWRDFGEQQAWSRLQYELDHQRITDAIGDENCSLYLSTEDHRTVSCYWHAEIGVFWSEAPVGIDFESVATIDATGALIL